LFPPPVDPYDPTGDSGALAATRALLTVRSRTQAAAVLMTAIDDLGGYVVPARLAGPDAIPVDVSLGVGEPMVVVVLDPLDLSSLRLARHLPLLVEDALSAARRCVVDERLRIRAGIDPLTGVATRTEIEPRLHRSAPGDVVCLLVLDGLERVNDAFGRAAGNEALAALGAVLRDGITPEDFVGRFGADEFIVILAATSAGTASAQLTRLTSAWAAQSGHRPGVSIGAAAVGSGGAAIAGRAAAAALHRSKRRAEGGVEVATPMDYPLRRPRP
jgi:diguanylate cyclase (GGDEF)-like protein